MSKTGPSLTASRPPNDADDWLNGTGKETQKNEKTERRKHANTSEKPARLTIDVPQELHGRFKAACAKHRTKMKDEVLAFIEQWTQKHS
jgi:hypothetical protein